MKRVIVRLAALGRHGRQAPRRLKGEAELWTSSLSTTPRRAMRNPATATIAIAAQGTSDWKSCGQKGNSVPITPARANSIR